MDETGMICNNRIEFHSLVKSVVHFCWQLKTSQPQAVVYIAYVCMRKRIFFAKFII